MFGTASAGPRGRAQTILTRVLAAGALLALTTRRICTRPGSGRSPGLVPRLVLALL
jgi:hypothetical protein